MSILYTAYFPPVQWFTKLLEGRVFVEACETYHKQTYRNRCIIDSPQGPLALTVPVVHRPAGPATETDGSPDAPATISQLHLSDHGNWRHQHWQAFTSSYRNTPYFEFYADDFRPFFSEPFDLLIDFNEAIVRKVCELIGLDVDLQRTASYAKTVENDLRELISPKRPYADDSHFHPVPYYQVFAAQHGFLPNLSIADLLFNMGPESLLVLEKSRI